MSILRNLGLLFFLLLGCKEVKQEKLQDNAVQTKEIVPKKNIEKDSIRVFNISFNGNEQKNKTQKVSTITQNLLSKYIEYPFTNDANELNDIKQGYSSKSFQKTLASGFNNKDFLDVASIHYSYVVPNNNKKSSHISIEEWQFKDAKKARSCFESLTKYKDAEIYFKTINWIWVYQEDKIFLVFATDYIVTDPEMQNIKQEVIKTISKSGDYKTIQFYE
ncbi:hypothetical protein [uncultured Lacinutrix sp.]|uniref:hypothetical protein n=1 Tax=uncultured Lacinutrix sp. TaxID=574032 RepID=UPI002624BD2B|nr:hypothetical protein [uncultured Lacinutrix sp.]